MSGKPTFWQLYKRTINKLDERHLGEALELLQMYLATGNCLTKLPMLIRLMVCCSTIWNKEITTLRVNSSIQTS